MDVRFGRSSRAVWWSYAWRSWGLPFRLRSKMDALEDIRPRGEIFLIGFQVIHRFFHSVCKQYEWDFRRLASVNPIVSHTATLERIIKRSILNKVANAMTRGPLAVMAKCAVAHGFSTRRARACAR